MNNSASDSLEIKLTPDTTTASSITQESDADAALEDALSEVMSALDFGQNTPQISATT